MVAEDLQFLEAILAAFVVRTFPKLWPFKFTSLKVMALSRPIPIYSVHLKLIRDPPLLRCDNLNIFQPQIRPCLVRIHRPTVKLIVKNRVVLVAAALVAKKMTGAKAS